MGNVSKFGCLAFAVMLGACSQPEPQATMIRGEPMFDKYGDVSGCDGGVYIPGAALQDQCLPPPDECDNQTSSAAPGLPCPPPRREREDRDDDDRPSNDPTGGPTRPAG